jgi:gliding motility-associated-like protein
MFPEHMWNKIFFGLLIWLLPVVAASAQDLPEYNMSNTTISDCQGILYDSGGPDNPYGMNENITTVINAGGVITITFTGTFALEVNVDSLFVYDGPSSASPLLGAFTGQNLPPQLTASSGIATVVLNSDNTIAGSGFSLEWSSQQPIPVPPAISVNTIPACNASQVNVNLSSAIQCSWLTTAVFTVSANGQDIPISSVQPNCAGGQTNIITLILGQPFSYNCTFNVTIDLEIPDNCGILYPFTLNTTFLFANCGVNATITSDANTVCPGQCANISAEVVGCLTYTYAWNNGLPATAGPHQVCPSAQTTYNVTITETETGNSVVKTFTLGIETIDIVTPDQIVCQSEDDITMQANGIGEWSGQGIINGTNLFDPDLANAGSNYVYFQTAGCIDSVEITVTPIETQFVTAACPGTATFQLEAIPLGGTWSGPNTTPDGFFDPITAGVYEVEYAVNGCVDLLTVNVDTIVGPFTFDSICQSVWFDTLSFSPIGGQWSGVGITHTTLGEYEPQAMTAGDHQFTYTINGCSQVFDIFVKEIDIEYFTEACPQENPFILDNTPIPTGGTWSSPDGAITNANTGLFDPAAIANDVFTYALYQAPNGCVDTIFVYVIATEVETESLDYCVNDPLIVLDSAVTGIVIPESGIWTGTGVTGDLNNGFSFNPSIAGVGEHTLTYTQNNCTDVITVTVYPSDLNDPPQQFCSSDDPLVISPTTPLGGTWSGSGIVNATAGLFDPSAAEPGTFFLYWTNPAGCEDSISVTVEEEVFASITGIDDTYCLISQNVTYSVEPTGGILTGSLSGFTFNPATLGEGSYEVIYSYTPLYCDQTRDTVEFVVLPALEVTAVANDILICDDQAVTITTTVVGGNSANGYTYSWSNGGFPVANNTSVPGVPTTITVTVSDNCSDPVEASVTIDVVPPILALVDTSETVCAGQQGWVTVDVALPDGSFSTEWNGNVSADTLFANAGTSWQLVVTDLVNGCTFEDDGQIPAYPAVIANFSVTPNDPCIAFEDMSNIGVIDLSQNGVTGTWDFGNGLTLPYVEGQNLNQSYTEPGNFEITLTIENEGGCTSEASNAICILPDEPIFIPDIFSPNGDRRNDTLFVRGFGVTKLDFRLYDRWGEEVFRTTNTSVGWDGQLRGQPASSGSYFYTMVATTGNEKAEKSGEIVLVR